MPRRMTLIVWLVLPPRVAVLRVDRVQGYGSEHMEAPVQLLQMPQKLYV